MVETFKFKIQLLKVNTKKMKNLKIIAIALVSVFSFSSCSNDDPINEEEVITTVPQL
jgi:hypothetical protein